MLSNFLVRDLSKKRDVIVESIIVETWRHILKVVWTAITTNFLLEKALRAET